MAAKWRPWRVAGGHSTVGTRSWRAGTYATTGADWPLVHDTVALGFRFPAVFAAIAAISRFAGGWLLAFGAFTRIAACLIVTTTVTALGFNMQASAW